MSKNTMNRKLFILFSLMWLADTIFTLMFVQKYGIEAEANPLLRYVMETGGMVSFCGVKLATWGIWYYAQLMYKEHNKKEINCTFNALLIAIMAPVVITGGIMAL